MRLAILADIHGNLPALEAVLDDMQQQCVDGVVVAGDFSDGPCAPDVLCILRELDCWMIRGNRENYYLSFDAGNMPANWRFSDQWSNLRWMYERLERSDLDFFATLPEQRVVSVDGAAPIRVVHGSPGGVSELLMPEQDADAIKLYEQAGLTSIYLGQIGLDAALAQIDEPVLVCGHSHISWRQRLDDRLALNPGSVGAPINGDARAQYALLTLQTRRWEAELRAIPYDLDRIRAAYRETGLLAEGGVMARAFLLCVETGQNVPGRFIAYFRKLASKAGFEKAETIPDSIWEEAADTFDWEAAANPDHG